MKAALLLIAFAQAVICGNIARTSSLLSPAGVTYVDGSYHAGLAAGPVGYSSSVSASAAPIATVTASPAVYSSATAAAPVAAVTASPAVYSSAPAVAAVSAAPAVYSSGASVSAAPVAAISAGHTVYSSGASISAAPVSAASADPAVYSSGASISSGPAFYASAPSLSTGPTAVAAAPVVASAPVAYAAPVTKYAAVPTVQHVPAVADVPVTRINAQPGVIQKTVDVARPAVKTQRFEVRRPAIQKQFYDIEERVVVRPAGSAVVELEEPLSRTQKGPSVIRPTGGAVTVSSGQAIAVPTGPGISSITSGSGVSSIPTGPSPITSVDYSIGGDSGSDALPPAPPSAQAPIAVSSPVYSGQASAVFAPAAPIQSAPLYPVAVSAPAQAVSVAAPIQPISASAPAQPIGGVSTISAGSSGLHSFTAGSSSGLSFSTPAPQYSDDAVSIESAAYRSPALSQRTSAYPSSGLSSDGIRGFSGTYYQAAAAPQVYSAPAVPSSHTIFRSALPTTRYSGHVASAPASTVAAATYPTSLGFSAPQHRFTSAIYSDGGARSQINHENQQKLIQLLTARGGVTEVGFGRSGPASYPVDAGEVRSRVISATPAPAYAAPTNERVNTRRVVVSRPIETLQEVEVAEPVTKYERVQVSQPTVIKTASQDVVRVPTSVPVYGKALAAVAEESYAALSSEWQ